MASFVIGDRVRVRHARRRDIHFTVTEVLPQVVVAVNDRGGEARYSPEAFEPIGATATDAHEGSMQQAALEPRVGDSVEAPRHLPMAPAEMRDGITVRPFPGENIDALIRRFKRTMDRSNVLREHGAHRFFVPKPQKRLEKSLRARKRRAKVDLQW